MSRGGTLIFLCVRLVSASLCFRPLASLPVCVYVRLYPCLSVSLPVCTPSVCTLNTVAHRALFHRSLSNLSGSVCSSRLSCSFLISLILSFHSSFSLSFSLLLFFSDIFSSYSYSIDPSCSSRDTPFLAENPVSRADFRTLGSFSFRDTPFPG